jgi:uncharacterized protein (TIGR00369 family)
MNDQPPKTAAPAFDPAAAGWTLQQSAAFGTLVGPFWTRADGTEPSLGVVVHEKHLNRAGNGHGGLMMTLADQAMALAARRATAGKPHATIELNIQFVGAVRLGDFIAAHAEVVRVTRSVIFMRAKMLVGQRVVATTNGIWKILDEG